MSLLPVIPKNTSFQQYQFTFLNQSAAFSENNIDWNYLKFGKLWTYNLNYFDFLLQPEMLPETGLQLIEDYISKLNNNSSALEPYPIALRGINWIKFISHCSFSNSQILKFSSSLYAHYQILLNNIEYHLLGNHLLEDGFSLLFGAFYFRDQRLYSKARQIIEAELKEQILTDGAHFELSPMYHQILIDRLLDCINLLQNNDRFSDQKELLELMNQKAVKMLQWLNAITFSNGDIPHLNDSAPDIAASTDELNQYATRLGIIDESVVREIRVNPCNLSQSGYRSFRNNKYECIVDIGQIGPSYQPGHAHADTFNFVLNVNDLPFIVDTGISTYEANESRLKERSTSAHNTVTVQDKNSSEVWSSFRVGKRALVEIIKEDDTSVCARHDGYRDLKTMHRREWKFSDNGIEIEDVLEGQLTEGKALFWLSPGLEPICEKKLIEIGRARITFTNSLSVNLIPVSVPAGYNKFDKSYKIEIPFKNQLKTHIIIE